MSRQLKSVKSNPLASRIKKVMQADEDVGKIAQGAPVLVCEFCSKCMSKAAHTDSKDRPPDHCMQRGQWRCFWLTFVRELLKL